jgi:NADH dehydrogenase FAD-containing subunit
LRLIPAVKGEATMKSTARPGVVVLGAGFGGLEASRYARLRLPRTNVTLVSDNDYFLFKPNSIYIPFGMDPSRLMLKLAGPARRENIHFVHAAAREVDPIAKRVYVESGGQVFDIPYDFLVIATGATMRAAEIPGLDDYSTTMGTPEEMLRLRAALHRVVEEARAGERRRVLLLVAPHNRYSGPLYELAMVLDTWLRRKHTRAQVEITFSTYEESYIQAFGPRLHEVVTSEFRVRGIEGFTGLPVDHVEPGRAFFRNGEILPFDLLIAFPPCVASARLGALPADGRGFIATDLATRQVVGYPEIYAVGDTADFPVKQAALAFLQADAAAEHLSAQVLGTHPRVSFDPASMHLVETLDKAGLGISPLRFAGPGPTGPAGVREAHADEEMGLHNFGTSPLWTPARRMVGPYLPWRFKAGNPFHGNAPWKGMELGLKTG